MARSRRPQPVIQCGLNFVKFTHKNDDTSPETNDCNVPTHTTDEDARSVEGRPNLMVEEEEWWWIGSATRKDTRISLLDLHTEILLMLPLSTANSTDRSAIISLTLTCRKLYLVLRSQLYKHIHLVHNHDAEHKCLTEQEHVSQLLRSLEANPVLAAHIRYLSIEPWIHYSGVKLLRRSVRSWRLRAITLVGKGVNCKNCVFYARVFREFIKLPTLTKFSVKISLGSWILGYLYTIAWREKDKNSSIKHVTLNSDLITTRYYLGMLGALQSLKTLTLDQERTSRNDRNLPARATQGMDEASFTSVYDAYKRVRRLEILEPRIGDAYFDDKAVLRTALRNTTRLKSLTLFPEALFPWNKATDALKKPITPEVTKHFVESLPTSIIKLTLLIEEHGHTPRTGPRGRRSWLLDIIEALWPQKERFKHLRTLIVRAHDRPLSHFRPFKLINSPLCYMGAEGVRYTLIPAGDLKKMITGTKYYLGIDLGIEIDGIEMGRPASRQEMRTLRSQDYYLLPRDIRGVLCRTSKRSPRGVRTTTPCKKGNLIL